MDAVGLLSTLKSCPKLTQKLKLSTKLLYIGLKSVDTQEPNNEHR